MPLIVIGLKSRTLTNECKLIEELQNSIEKNDQKLQDRDILVISSKIAALSQGRLIRLKTVSPGKEAQSLIKKCSGVNGKKDARLTELILREADRIFPGRMILALKENILIPQAGIDLSNAPKGFAILWPEKPWSMARKIWCALRKKFLMKNLGIIICDSHCQPLRWGTTGLAIAWAGFKGVKDVRGEKDIYGKPLRVTRKAMADNLASAGLLVMGEGSEKIPFVIIRHAPVKFTARQPSNSEIFVKPEQCLFSSIYASHLRTSFKSRYHSPSHN